jgi:hypothetical protein
MECPLYSRSETSSERSSHKSLSGQICAFACAADLPDGQIAHAYHAKIARRANLSQSVGIAVIPNQRRFVQGSQAVAHLPGTEWFRTKLRLVHQAICFSIQKQEPEFNETSSGVILCADRRSVSMIVERSTGVFR